MNPDDITHYSKYCVTHFIEVPKVVKFIDRKENGLLKGLGSGGSRSLGFMGGVSVSQEFWRWMVVVVAQE